MKKKKNRKILISVGVAVLLVFSVLTAATVGVSEEAEAPAVEEEDSDIAEDTEMNLDELLSNLDGRDPMEPMDQLDVIDPEITQLLSGGDYSGEVSTSSDGPGLMTDPHTIDQHHVEAVHDIGIYGDGVQVSLMDTGFDMAHPDLIGTHAVFEYDDATMDENMSVYDGHPIAFDPVSMADYAYDGEISQDYHVWEAVAPDLTDNSWYVNTSYEAQTYEDEGYIWADYGDETYNVTEVAEDEEDVRFGDHPDEKLHSWYGERPAVLLTQDENEDWTNVYVDLLNNRVFKEESGAWIDGGDPESEVITKDLNEDGIADVSGGMLYFVADGEMPIPYSQHFRETMNKIINLYMGYPPGTLGAVTEYEDAWHAITGQDEIHTTPGDGEMIALMGDFNDFGAMGAHGTWTASAVAGQGVTGVPEEDILTDEPSPYPPTPEGSEGLPRGLAPNATIIPMGRFFDYLPEDNPLGIAQVQVPVTYSSLFFTADGYTGDPGITCDTAAIASSSFGRTIDENHGGFNFYERLFDYVGTQYTQNTLFINSQGNEGSGFGTVSAPSGGQGVLSVGATGNQLYRVDPWEMHDGGPNPWYGEVTGMTSTGPHSKGSHGPDIMTNGQFGYGSDPVNQQVDPELDDPGFQGNNSWTLWSGTSLSAPNAAGIAALVYEAYEEAHGEAPDAETLKNIIMQGADDINNSPHLQGPGEANAYDSVMIAQKEGLYSEEFQWRPGTNPEMNQHVEHHVNMMEAGEEQTDEMTLHNWNETDEIAYEMGAYKQEKVGNTSIELESGPPGRVPLLAINETGVYELIYNQTNDNWDLSEEPVAVLDEPDADLLRFGTHTPYENQGLFDYSLTEFYDWTDVNENGSFDGWEERNRIGYTATNMMALNTFLGLEVPTSDYFTIHDALERAEDGIIVQMNNDLYEFGATSFDFTLNIEQYNQVEWDWIEIDEPTGSIDAGDTLEYKITAEVPEDAIKGIYGGKLMIEDITNERTHPIPITITVGEETDLSGQMQFGAAEGEDDHGIYRNDRLFGSWEGGLTGDWRFYTFHLTEDTEMPVDVNLEFDNELSDMSAFLLGGAEHDMLGLGMTEDPFSDPTWGMQDRYGVNTLETLPGSHFDDGDSVSFVTHDALDAGTYMVAVQSHQISGHEPYQEFSGEVSEIGVDWIEVEPAYESVIAGENVTYTATAYNETYGKTEDVTEHIDWEIHDDAGGTWYQKTGTYVSENPGQWVVNASYEFEGEYYNDTADLFVGDIDHIGIYPVDESVIKGSEVTYTAIAYNETEEEIREVTGETNWYIYEEDHSEHWEENVYTAEEPGEWTVNASFEYEGEYYNESTGLNVGIPDWIEIEPKDHTATAGESIEYTATAYNDTFGELEDVTPYTEWYICEEDHNEYWEDNIYTPEIAGDWTVDASYEYEGEYYNASTSLTVEPGDVDYVEIDPAEDQIIEAGETIDFSAEAYDEYDNLITDDDTEFTWENTDESGLFDETETGEYKINATYEGMVSDTVTVTVEPGDVDYVEIDPAEDQTIEAGETIDFSAEAYDEYDNLITDDDTNFTWENTDETGLFDETEAGEYEVTATYEGVTSEPTIVTVELDEYTLTIDIDGEGTVTVEWDDHTEEVDDSATFDIPEGTEVTLTAEADEDWEFDEWEGTDETGDTITITMDEDKEITAVFEEDEVDDIYDLLEEIPGFTTILLILGAVIAVAIYHKKEQ